MLVLRLTKVGTGIGVILPKEMLGHLQAGKVKRIYATETPTGYFISRPDPRVEKQVMVGEAFMEEHRDVFVALAKEKEPGQE